VADGRRTLRSAAPPAPDTRPTPVHNERDDLMDLQFRLNGRAVELAVDGDRTLLWLNIFFFMLVSLLPFSTSVLNAFPRALVAPFLFGVNIASVGWFLFFQWSYVNSRSDMLAPFVTTEHRAAVTFRMLAVPMATTLTAFMCFWSAGISVAVYLLLLPFYMLPGRSERQIASADTAGSATGPHPIPGTQMEEQPIVAWD